MTTISASERFGPRGCAHKPKERFTSWMVPAALGHGYDTPFGVWLAITGRKPPPQESKEMERGKGLEAALISWGADHLDMQQEIADYRRHTNGWSGDFVDCLYANRKTGEVVGVVEAKTVAQGNADRWGHPGTDEIPLGAFVQCQWHLMHYPSVDTVYVPVLFGGYRFHFEMYQVRRDAVTIDKVTAEAKAWWDAYVVPDVAPPFAAGDTDWLNDRYKCVPESQADISDEMVEAVSVRLKYEPIQKKAEKLIQAANNRIRDCMGSAHRAKTDRFSVTWGGGGESTKVDYKAALEDLMTTANLSHHARAALLDKYTQTVQASRRLTVTGRGDWKLNK